jgi:hypothetical protein
MAGKSIYLENKVLDHMLGGPDYVRPATVYLALFTLAPTDAGGGTEVTGGSYARVTVTNNATNFPAAVSGAKALATEQTFPTSTANWGTVVAMGIYDDIAAGNLLMWANLVVSQAVPDNKVAIFRQNKITFQED